MCCILALAGLIGPRIAIAVWYLLDPLRWAAVFPGGPLLPIAGFLLLPWTTLAYVFLGAGALQGLGLGVLIVAVIADLSAYGGGIRGRARRV